MITLMDIQKTISRRLDSRFSGHYVYTEEVKQGLKRPSFFINIMPINTNNFVIYKDKLVNIDIMYFGKNETNEESLNMVNELEDLFSITLAIKDREITIQSLNFKTIDNILHCGFSLDFTDSDMEFITINTPNGTIDVSKNEIDEKAGYTLENITTMQELEINESEVD